MIINVINAAAPSVATIMHNSDNDKDVGKNTEAAQR